MSRSRNMRFESLERRAMLAGDVAIVDVCPDPALQTPDAGEPSAAVLMGDGAVIFITDSIDPTNSGPMPQTKEHILLARRHAAEPSASSDGTVDIPDFITWQRAAEAMPQTREHILLARNSLGSGSIQKKHLATIAHESLSERSRAAEINEIGSGPRLAAVDAVYGHPEGTFFGQVFDG